MRLAPLLNKQQVLKLISIWKLDGRDFLQLLRETNHY
jgi:hypothetical protein